MCIRDRCIQCARELGIKPVDDMIKKMGLSDQDIEQMNSDVEDFIQSLEESGANLPDNFPFSADGTDDEESDGRAPACLLYTSAREVGKVYSYPPRSADNMEE